MSFFLFLYRLLILFSNISKVSFLFCLRTILLRPPFEHFFYNRLFSLILKHKDDIIALRTLFFLYRERTGNIQASPTSESTVGRRRDITTRSEILRLLEMLGTGVGHRDDERKKSRGMAPRAAAMLARWLVNVSWLTRDLPPTITHSHPLLTDYYFDPTPPWAGLFSSLSFFIHRVRLRSTRVPSSSSTCGYPYPSQR